MVTRQLHAANESRRHRRALTGVRAQLRRLPALAMGLTLVNVGIVGCNELPPADVPLPGRVNVDSGAADWAGGGAFDVGDGGVACDANRSSTRIDSWASP